MRNPSLYIIKASTYCALIHVPKLLSGTLLSSAWYMRYYKASECVSPRKKRNKLVKQRHHSFCMNFEHCESSSKRVEFELASLYYPLFYGLFI